MNTALGYVLVFVGGGLGAAARHWVNRTMLALVGPEYPAGTLMVNIMGSMAMGMVAAWFAFRGETTTAGDAAAIVYAGASVILSIFGLIAGLFIVRVPLS